MAQITVATTLYPMKDAWVNAFAEALAAAMGGRDCEAVVALDGIGPDAAARLLQPLAASAPLCFVEAAGAPATVRTAMLRAAQSREAEATILVDADDLPLPDAIDSHCRALAHGDVSFGDMLVIDEDGRLDGTCFFAGSTIASRVSGGSALERVNFMGLTNTALGARALAAIDREPPADIAAYDWWLFRSLLEAGFVAARTDRPVTRYRDRRDAVLGARPDPRRFAKRCRMVAAQGRAFANRPESVRYGAAADRLAEQVGAEPARFADRIAAACAEPGVWFADVDRLVTGGAA